MRGLRRWCGGSRWRVESFSSERGRWQSWSRLVGEGGQPCRKMQSELPHLIRPDLNEVRVLF